MKLHGILVSLLFAIVIITAFIQFYDAGSQAYGVENDQRDELDNFTAGLEDINEIATDTKSAIQTVQANPLIPDTLGTIVVGGIGGVLTALESIDVFTDLSIATVEFLPIGDLADTLLTAAIAALVIVFFIGIAAHYYRQSDRL